MYQEMIGSSKTLSINIVKLRAALGRRGPWRRCGLRKYHDELLYDLATAKRRSISLGCLREHMANPAIEVEAFPRIKHWVTNREGLRLLDALVSRGYGVCEVWASRCP